MFANDGHHIKLLISFEIEIREKMKLFFTDDGCYRCANDEHYALVT